MTKRHKEKSASYIFPEEYPGKIIYTCINITGTNRERFRIARLVLHGWEEEEEADRIFVVERWVGFEGEDESWNIPLGTKCRWKGEWNRE